MSVATLTWFTVAACILYAVIVDANVYTWIVLQVKKLNLESTRLWYRVRYHPDSPWVRYEVKRNADRLAEEFLKETKNR